MRKYGIAYLVDLSTEDLGDMATNRLVAIYRKVRSLLIGSYDHVNERHTQPELLAFQRRLSRVLRTREHVPNRRVQRHWRQRVKQGITSTLKAEGRHMARRKKQRLLNKLRAIRKQKDI